VAKLKKTVTIAIGIACLIAFSFFCGLITNELVCYSNNQPEIEKSETALLDNGRPYALPPTIKPIDNGRPYALPPTMSLIDNGRPYRIRQKI
jgi:hypothetical protein